MANQRAHAAILYQTAVDQNPFLLKAVVSQIPDSNTLLHVFK
jgi:hypothetical protein